MEEQQLWFDNRELYNKTTLQHCFRWGLQPNYSTITLSLRYNRGRGGPLSLSIHENEFEPEFNFAYPLYPPYYGLSYQRGFCEFLRPYGWMKYAIRVVGKYESDDWLGVSANPNRTFCVQGEWPVSYHGTAGMCVGPIVKKVIG